LPELYAGTIPIFPLPIPLFIGPCIKKQKKDTKFSLKNDPNYELNEPKKNFKIENFGK
jgi:hypothetical protein